LAICAASVRRFRGDDTVYFDAANGCWVSSVALGYSPDGKRRRRSVRGRTKTQVRDKLRGLKEDISSSVRAPAGYTVRQAVEDWLESGLVGRSESTVAKYRSVLKPVVQRIGRAVLRDLTAHDERRALTVLAREQSSATVAIAHNALTRAIRHAESRDLVRRNVSALVDTPGGGKEFQLLGQSKRPSPAVGLDRTDHRDQPAARTEDGVATAASGARSVLFTPTVAATVKQVAADVYRLLAASSRMSSSRLSASRSRQSAIRASGPGLICAAGTPAVSSRPASASPGSTRMTSSYTPASRSLTGSTAAASGKPTPRCSG